MQRSEAAQLNIHYSVVPAELLGKNGENRLTNNGKRFTSSKIMTAALLTSREIIFGDGCKTTYKDFSDEMSLARSTIARDVAELAADGIIKRAGQSKFTAAYDYDIKKGVPVYHFLRTEKFNGKRLTGNAAYLASVLIRFYLNSDREQKYFIGGEKRVATILNVSKGTAHGVIKQLLDTDVIQRFMLEGGKLTAGKGINSDYPTVYTVAKEILNKVKKIKKLQAQQKADAKAVKAIFEAPIQQAKPEPRKENLLDQWQSTLDKIETVKNENRIQSFMALFKDDFEFNRLQQSYKTTLNKYISAIRASGGRDTDDVLELQRQIDCILTDTLNFLLAHNIQRKEIPDDWEAFIRNLLNS